MAVTTVVRRIGAGVVADRARRRPRSSSRWRCAQHAPVVPSCDGRARRDRPYTLDVEQAASATTIAAVGKRLGLPDHAVTVALAAALQESQLRNLAYGDRDSLGLFQQRPSQGWGTATEILTPSYAAAAFFRALQRIPSWETLPITDAAQKVQLSGAPTAYAKWETEARTLADRADGRDARPGSRAGSRSSKRREPAPDRSRSSMAQRARRLRRSTDRSRSPRAGRSRAGSSATRSNSASRRSRSTVGVARARPVGGDPSLLPTAACASSSRPRDLVAGRVSDAPVLVRAHEPGLARPADDPRPATASTPRTHGRSTPPECEKSIGETVSGHSGGSTCSSTADSKRSTSTTSCLCNNRLSACSAIASALVGGSVSAHA